MVLIYDVLDGVRERPALFMGSKSITVLRSFLDGVVYASHILGIDDGYFLILFEIEFVHSQTKPKNMM